MRLRIDDLERHLLLKNGNYLYKVPFREGFAVLKVYQGSRTWFEYALKSVGNIALLGGIFAAAMHYIRFGRKHHDGAS